MQEFPLALLLSVAGLARATFYYYVKWFKRPDKYRDVKDEIATIYHEHKGRYGNRRITIELHQRGFSINHKAVQRLMKMQGLVCRVRMKKYKSYKGMLAKLPPTFWRGISRLRSPIKGG